jgi:L-iditol 2-dehydrogenase
MTSGEPISMPVLRKHSLKPCDVSVDVAPVPGVGPGDVLVKVGACGICGGDVHAFRSDPGYQWLRTPVTLGHEFSGTVVSTGSNVTDLQPGQQVVAVSVQGCNTCETCVAGLTQLCPERRFLGMEYDGGMASFAVVPARYLVSFGADLDLTTAALAEPLSVAVHAVSTVARVGTGAAVVVSGPGPIGLLCGLVAAAAGADVLVLGTSVDCHRLEVGRSAGLGVATIDSSGSAAAVQAHFGERGPEVWLEASGAGPAATDALRLLRPAGRLVVVGMFKHDVPVSFTDAVRRHLSILFSFASSVTEYRTALDLLESGAIDVSGLIELYPLSRAVEAIEDAAAARAIKAIVRPDRA